MIFNGAKNCAVLLLYSTRTTKEAKRDESGIRIQKAEETIQNKPQYTSTLKNVLFGRCVCFRLGLTKFYVFHNIL